MSRNAFVPPLDAENIDKIVIIDCECIEMAKKKTRKQKKTNIYRISPRLIYTKRERLILFFFPFHFSLEGVKNISWRKKFHPFNDDIWKLTRHLYRHDGSRLKKGTLLFPTSSSFARNNVRSSIFRNIERTKSSTNGYREWGGGGKRRTSIAGIFIHGCVTGSGMVVGQA